ncbi:MAG: hypothetical protein Q8K72_13420 [Acidimicrobiales bacterium]|jgi:hypothetical protein|nr:hypothetical protein [Acidimicrobiales bacterium]
MRSGLPERARLELRASRDTQDRIAELEQRAFELGEELARRGEELEAVRQLNGELMAKVSPLATESVLLECSPASRTSR